MGYVGMLEIQMSMGSSGTEVRCTYIPTVPSYPPLSRRTAWYFLYYSYSPPRENAPAFLGQRRPMQRLVLPWDTRTYLRHPSPLTPKPPVD